MAVVAVATACAFLPALRAGFVVDWDDGISIVNNPHLRSFDLRWMFTDLAHNPRFMPLAWLRWTLTYQFFGLAPLAYHAGNLIFHVFNAVLVFALLRSLTREASPAMQAAACAAGALAWSIHPLRAEPVTWATDGSYSQALFFLLLSLLLHLRWTRMRDRLAWGLAVLSFAAAVLSHPVVAGGAGVFFALDLLLLVPAGPRRLADKLPYVALSAAAFALTVFSRLMPESIWARPPRLDQFGMLARLAQALWAIVWYVWRVFVPVGLSPVYTPLVSFDPLSWPFVLSALLVAGTTAVAWWKRQGAPWFLAAWASYLGLLAPCLGWSEHPFFPCDRYDHLASIVWALLLAGGLLGLRPGPVLRIAGAATTAGLVILGALTWKQTGIWKDTLTLYGHLLETLGDDPYRIEIYKRLADYHTQRGEWAQALQSWDALLAADPGKTVILGRRGLTLFRLGEYGRAEADFAALLKNQQDPQILRLHGMAVAHQGRYAEALAELRTVVAALPRDVAALESLARVLSQSGDPDEAREVLERALALAPGEKRLLELREQLNARR